MNLVQCVFFFLNPISRKTSALLPHLLPSVCRLLYCSLMLRQLPLEAERQQHISAVNGFFKSLVIMFTSSGRPICKTEKIVEYICLFIYYYLIFLLLLSGKCQAHVHVYVGLQRRIMFGYGSS